MTKSLGTGGLYILGTLLLTTFEQVSGKNVDYFSRPQAEPHDLHSAYSK